MSNYVDPEDKSILARSCQVGNSEQTSRAKHNTLVVDRYINTLSRPLRYPPAAVILSIACDSGELCEAVP